MKVVGVCKAPYKWTQLIAPHHEVAHVQSIGGTSRNHKDFDMNVYHWFKYS